MAWWNTPKSRLSAKYRMLRHRYGLTKDQADALNLVKACPICGRQFAATILDPKKVKRNMPHIDHNHATGKVRGVLCGLCNQFAGRIEKMTADGTLAKFQSWISQTDLPLEFSHTPTPEEVHVTTAAGGRTQVR